MQVCVATTGHTHTLVWGDDDAGLRAALCSEVVPSFGSVRRQAKNQYKKWKVKNTPVLVFKHYCFLVDVFGKMAT